MKPLLLSWLPAALLALGAAHPAHAQLGGVQLGLKAGLGLATYTGAAQLSPPADWRPVLAAGLVATRALSPLSGVQVEVLYAQKGAGQYSYAHTYRDPTCCPASSTYLATLGYLDVPVLYTLGEGSGGGQGLFVEAGPQLSLALHRQELVRPGNEPAGGPHQEILGTDARALTPVAVGYVTGVGYQWANGLGAELRYSGDFTTVYRAGYGSGCLAPGNSNQLHNGVLQVQLRYLFGKRRPAPAGADAPAERPLPPPVVVPDGDPGLRRLVRVLEVLSWLNFQWGPGGHSALPRPGGGALPPPRPSLPARRLPLPGPVLR